MTYYMTLGSGQPYYPGYFTVEADDENTARLLTSNALSNRWCGTYTNIKELYELDNIFRGTIDSKGVHLILSTKNVNETLRNCMPGDDFERVKSLDDLPENIVLIEGVINSYLIDKTNLTTYKDIILELLLQLPDNFRESIGGGWSFLNACYTKNDVHWGEHIDVERLMVLGIAIDRVVVPMAKRYWQHLPGGMPYFVVCDR